MSLAPVSVSLDEPLPHNTEAERAVLGAIIINNNAFYRVIGTIDTESFFKDHHRKIFAAMRALAEQSRPVDLLTLTDQLLRSGELKDIGGSAYLSSLVDVVPDIANVEWYADLVRETANKRRLILMGNSVMRAATDVTSTSSEVLTLAEKSLYDIAESATDKGFVGLGAITRTNMGAIEQMHANAGRLVTGLPTGYDRFNEMTSGFQPQDLIILAARPSMGKAQPLDAKVLTRRGWKCMGSLQIGDELASVDGRESRVVGVFPQGERDVYRVELSDGRSAECCLEHLWRVHYRTWPEPRVLSTERLLEMLQRQRYRGRLYVETFSGEFGNDDDLPLDPWVQGASLRDARQQDEARIPDSYLSASRQFRMQLLRGLLGIEEGSTRFTTFSERMLGTVIDLVRSVGGIAAYDEEPSAGSPSNVCNVQLPSNTKSGPPNRLTIRSITLTRATQTQCIAVSHPSQLYVTNGFTVTHNTSFMMNMAESIALPGKDGLPRNGGDRLYGVGVFSLEMSKEQIGLRVLSSESGVSNHLIRSGMLSERNWRDLADAASRLAKGKIYIDDTAGMDPLEMRAKARRLKMEAGLDMIMVDYLQLMSVKGKIESRQQEISQISRGLKAIAKELNVPVLSLSQLSRRPEQRAGDHRPQLSDLRESGSIEQDADLVCFIYRDEVYNKETEDKGIAEIIIAKQRNGPIGDFKLVFRNDITKFFNYEPQPEYLPPG